MKSIYSKLILAFYYNRSFLSVAGFVSLRLNDQQIESTDRRRFDYNK